VAGFHVLDAMRGGADHMLRFGGHAQAAGCEVEPARVDDLRRAICARAAAMLAETDGHPPAELAIDAELAFGDVTPELMAWVDRLEPFGEGNPTPVFASRDLRLAEPPRVVGRDGAHLLLRLRREHHVLKAMAFRLAGRVEELKMGAPLEAAFTPRWNTFRGETNLELVLHDFRVHRA
jgi:single-stranded-DNA-specific exonuclease